MVKTFNPTHDEEVGERLTMWLDELLDGQRMKATPATLQAEADSFENVFAALGGGR